MTGAAHGLSASRARRATRGRSTVRWVLRPDRALRFVVGFVRGSSAVAVAIAAASQGPDPRDVEPRAVPRPSARP